VDSERFDRLTRHLATRAPRRAFLRGALAAGAAALLGRASPAMAELQGDCSSYAGMACQGDGECQGPPGTVPLCPQLACCGGVCADLTYDNASCGACGLACPEGSTCDGGQCVSACQSPLVDCGGACVDPMTDPNNCGDCFAICEAGTICAGGICACEGGLTNCGGFCVDLLTDPANCGDCGGTCIDGAACAEGTCVCGGGLSDCAGACIDLASDPANCGACGVMCADGGVCREGACEVICPSGTKACDGACVDTSVDAAHCGDCGNRCPDGTSCVDGQCPASESTETTDVVREVPSAELCVARPPTAEDLRRIASTASTPDPSAGLPEMLDPAGADALMATGTEVDSERQQAAVTLVRGALGCENAGDAMAGLGGMTDDGIRATLVERGWTAEIVDLLDDAPAASPLPADHRIGIAGPITVRQLPDGRLAVRVPLDPPVTPRPEPDPPAPDGSDGRIYVVADLPGGYLVDRIVPITPTGAPEPKLPGSIAVQLEVCPPGMTYEDFAASACEPVQVYAFAPALYAKPGDPDLPPAYDPGMAYLDKYQSTSVPEMAWFDPAWDGMYLYVRGLEVGRTWWVELRAGPGGHESGFGIIPGATGLSLADGRTFWGVPLTVARHDAVVRAYLFRPRACGTTCFGDQDQCTAADGTEVWVDLSSDPAHCGRCGAACPDGSACTAGVCG
jgi:hypothetical protein